jgi:uncharacterized protein (DUF927 family)
LTGVRTAIGNHSKNFLNRYVPANADGQVHRVAQRFALIGAAGEIAAEGGVLPWPPGEATKAAARVYEDWLAARGGVAPAEIRNGIAQVRSFLQAHGMSRFVPAWDEGHEARTPPRDIAGYRKRAGDGWDYYVTTSAWKEEVCVGLDPSAVAETLLARDLLIGGDGSHRARSVSVPGHGKMRLYHVVARIMEFEPDA